MEERLQILEDEEATLWFPRSRSKWLNEEEAPTSYFFHLVKHRLSRDRITGLKAEDGTVVRGRDDILKMITDYYQDIYNADFFTKFLRMTPVYSFGHRPGIFYAKKVIKRFEKASGASLNVQKSLVMALGGSQTRGWIWEIGCEIADDRRRFKFLGVLSGRRITQLETTEGIVLSIERRLQSWVNQNLTFTSRLLLIKHILSAIPAHYMMAVGLDSKGLTKVDRASRQFLWGFREDGKPKLSLIAWDKLHRRKERGGLGWTNIRNRMDTQLAFKVIRCIRGDEEPENWQRLAAAILHLHSTKSGRGEWRIPELLLLSNGLRIQKAPTLSRLLQNWFRVKKNLTIDQDRLEFPMGLDYTKLEAFLSLGDQADNAAINSARKWARKLGWKSTSDMISPASNWKDWRRELTGQALFSEEADKRAMELAWDPIWQIVNTHDLALNSLKPSSIPRQIHP
ncbi:hypothetical protein R1sor_007852 [Riccia sorocarpa]|uniref:Reverse transcriptase n=1 Tax=Riccia sorocarpa TaxID=122646 RepID=A0ABD3HTD8_9MARC